MHNLIKKYNTFFSYYSQWCLELNCPYCRVTPIRFTPINKPSSTNYQHIAVSWIAFACDFSRICREYQTKPRSELVTVRQKGSLPANKSILLPMELLVHDKWRVSGRNGEASVKRTNGGEPKERWRRSKRREERRRVAATWDREEDT